VVGDLKTREWIGIIVIVTLIHFMISYVSFDFGTSGRALGYISFAGTIVSIILGVIAILYSFYQSNSQANVVSEIKDQAVRIVEAGDHIVKSKDILFGSADQLKALTGELSVKLQENNNHNVEFKELLSRSLIEVKSVVGRSSSSDDVFSTNYYYLDICYAMIAEGVRRGDDWKSFKEGIVGLYTKEFGLPDHYMEGSVSAVVCVLETLGVIRREGKGDDRKMFFVNDSFKGRIEKVVVAMKAKKDSVESVGAYFRALECLDG
jgi:hypothetical protein